MAADAQRAGSAGARGNPSLGESARLWPTPSASVPNDHETPESWEARRQTMIAKGYNGNGAGTPLSIEAKLWATPRTITGGAESAQRKAELGREESGGSDLQAEVLEFSEAILPLATTSKAGDSGSTPVVLHPSFVEALMGFPTDWTVFGR